MTTAARRTTRAVPTSRKREDVAEEATAEEAEKPSGIVPNVPLQG